jgi:hypothetical protein
MGFQALSGKIFGKEERNKTTVGRQARLHSKNKALCRK